VPYTTNSRGQGPAFSNSLFENNAEFSLGMALAVRQQREPLAMTAKRLLEQTKDDLLKNALNAWLAGFDEAEGSRERADALAEAARENTAEADNALCAEILQNAEHLSKKSMWMYGGDGWAYDIGYGGLDHVLATGEDVNILVVDTEVYSNTGGQSSKATPVGAVAQFAAAGKQAQKKELGLLAMGYDNVYVAQVALGADQNQLLRALKEAEAHKGPSLIVAYAPCISHGIARGMAFAQDEARLAVQSGYWALYRYNPALKKEGKNPFILDSKAPTVPLVDFMRGEVRFSALERTFPERAKVLSKQAQQAAAERYEKYLKLAQ
jgi:pyruvate-ferredoxin/flavodoxin oxidoreductase